MSTAQNEAAAQWWADRLTSCRHSGLSPEERASGDNRSYEMAEMLMAINKPKVTPEQIERFRAILIEKLATADRWARQTIGVDYHPDQISADSLDAAGITSAMGTLPIKTCMWLNDDGTVRVRYGYGSEVQTIFEPPAEVVTA